MKKAIYKFHADCGRNGFLDGVLISTKEKVKKLTDSKVQVYFGEVLGKHSEIYGAIEDKEMTFITDDPVVIELFEKHDLTSGFNPFNYSSTGFEFYDYEDKFKAIEEDEWDELTVGEIVDCLLNN